MDEKKPHVMDEKKIQAALDEIRPMLEADGGGLTYLGMEGNRVKLQLVGACCGCPGARMTLKMGVERILRQKVSPEISVEAV